MDLSYHINLTKWITIGKKFLLLYGPDSFSRIWVVRSLVLPPYCGWVSKQNRQRCWLLQLSRPCFRRELSDRLQAYLSVAGTERKLWYFPFQWASQFFPSPDDGMYKWILFPDYHRTSASFNNRAGIAGVWIQSFNNWSTIFSKSNLRLNL